MRHHFFCWVHFVEFSGRHKQYNEISLHKTQNINQMSYGMYSVSVSEGIDRVMKEPNCDIPIAHTTLEHLLIVRVCLSEIKKEFVKCGGISWKFRQIVDKLCSDKWETGQIAKSMNLIITFSNHEMYITFLNFWWWILKIMVLIFCWIGSYGKKHGLRCPSASKVFHAAQLLHANDGQRNLWWLSAEMFASYWPDALLKLGKLEWLVHTKVTKGIKASNLHPEFQGNLDAVQWHQLGKRSMGINWCR